MGTTKVDFQEGDTLPDSSVTDMGGLVLDAAAMTAQQLSTLKAFLSQNGIPVVGAIVHPPPEPAGDPGGDDEPEDPPEPGTPPPPPPPPPPSGP